MIERVQMRKTMQLLKCEQVRCEQAAFYTSAICISARCTTWFVCYPKTSAKVFLGTVQKRVDIFTKYPTDD